MKERAVQFAEMPGPGTENRFSLAGVQKPADTLALALERIRLRGYRRVLWQRHLWKQTSQMPAQGLAIPHEEIEIVCLNMDNYADEARFYRSDPKASDLTEKIADLEAAWAETGGGRLGELAELFSLTAVETDMLLLAAAPEFDPRLRRLYGYLHDDAACCAPTLWLAQTLFEWNGSVRLTPGSPLIRWLLAYPGLSEEQPWSSMARWMADPRIVGYLCCHTDLPPSLQVAARWVEAEGDLAYEPQAARHLRSLIEEISIPLTEQLPRCAQVVGAEGVGRKAWAARVCAERGLKMLCLDAPRLLSSVSGNKDGPQSADAGAREKGASSTGTEQTGCPRRSGRRRPLKRPFSSLGLST
jgi:hypothetical protein